MRCIIKYDPTTTTFIHLSASATPLFLSKASHLMKHSLTGLEWRRDTGTPSIFQTKQHIEKRGLLRPGCLSRFTNTPWDKCQIIQVRTWGVVEGQLFCISVVVVASLVNSQECGQGEAEAARLDCQVRSMFIPLNSLSTWKYNLILDLLDNKSQCNEDLSNKTTLLLPISGSLNAWKEHLTNHICLTMCESWHTNKNVILMWPKRTLYILLLNLIIAFLAPKAVWF